MKKNISFSLKDLKPRLKKLQVVAVKHAAFAAALIVLIVYLSVVWHIKGLADAEPSNDAETTALAGAHLPKVDPQAISQIQSLEQSSPEVHSLFNQARNNPFQE